MKALGIIVEYNPMHNGHIYQIEQAKKLVKPDYTIVIMSGSFTEQGNISVLNKFDKAELAVKNGVDLVLELPTIFASSSAEYFAKGAINILNSLSTITHLAFGAECHDIKKLYNIANTLCSNHETIAKSCKEHKNKSINSAKTQAEVLSNILNEEELKILQKPNNILAIQYIKNILELKSSIVPVLIPRIGTEHGTSLVNGSFASSSAIRELLNSESIKKVSGLVPQNVYEKLLDIDNVYLSRYWQLLKYEITKLGVQGLKEIHEINEGLENRFYSVSQVSKSYLDFLQALQTKRYTLGRLKRICNNILLGITLNKAYTIYTAYYARVLKVNKNATELLTLFNEHSTIPVITSAKSANTKFHNVNSSLELDTLATKIHNLIFNTSCTEFENIITD